MARQTPLTTNERPSIANAHAGPAVTTTKPEIAGAATLIVFRDSDRKAFACWSDSLGTSSGTSPVVAGSKNASAAPKTASRIAKAATVAFPDASSTATVRWTTARTPSDVSITSRLGSRSATTPLISKKARLGIERAARTSPRAPTP